LPVVVAGIVAGIVVGDASWSGGDCVMRPSTHH
jgi:hypothetical protein